MAYTKIIVIRGRLDKCLSYAANEEKTYLETAVDYALDRGKTERVCYETAINYAVTSFARLDKIFNGLVRRRVIITTMIVSHSTTTKNIIVPTTSI